MKIRARFKKVLAIPVVAAALLLTVTTPAHAAIYWHGVKIKNKQTGQCMYDEGWTPGNDYEWPREADCNRNDLHIWWNLDSVRADTGYANVAISNYTTGACLSDAGGELGPSFPGIGGPSHATPLWNNDLGCGSDPSRTPADEVWAMTTAGPTLPGSTHQINFFSFYQRDCLDGGIGVYGFHKNGCNYGGISTWQTWLIVY
jgi:hypothetical protein